MSNKSDEFIVNFTKKFSTFCKEMGSLCETYIRSQGAKPIPSNSSFYSSSNNHGGVSKKKKKEAVDPNAPKKPVSSYILFFKQQKERFVQDNPDLPITEITKLIGKAWNELPEEKQQQYKDYAKILKDAYDKQYQQYLQNGKVSVGSAGGDNTKQNNNKGKTVNKNQQKQIVNEILSDDDEEGVEENINSDEDEDDVQEIHSDDEEQGQNLNKRKKILSEDENEEAEDDEVQEIKQPVKKIKQK